MRDLQTDAPLMALRKFQQLLGVSRTTCFRFRQRKWLRIVTIASRAYVTRQAIQDFVSRAEAGELSIPHGRSVGDKGTKSDQRA